MTKIVNRVRGIEVGDYILVKDANKDKIRYGKVFYIHPEKRFCVATITARYNVRYNETFTNDEVIIISKERAEKEIKEKYGPETEIKIKD